MVASCRPTVDAQGDLSVNVRVDKRIMGALNIPGAFTGKVNNSANIGKSTREEIVYKWNEVHPTDLIKSAEPGHNPFQACKPRSVSIRLTVEM